MIRLWIFLNVADLVVSLQAFELGHSEGNLVMSGMNSVELVVYKVGVTILSVVLLTQLGKQSLLKWCCLGMGMVVIWNLCTLRI